MKNRDEDLCEHEPCVGLASSTAYASKLNLDIFDSLFGARKKETSLRCAFL